MIGSFSELDQYDIGNQINCVDPTSHNVSKHSLGVRLKDFLGGGV